MNIHNNLILLKGEDKTNQIKSCKYEEGKYLIYFSNSNKPWRYGFNNVQWLRNPTSINTNSVKISRNGKVFFNISEILEFDNYWRIFFENGQSNVYKKCDLTIEKNALTNQQATDCLEYFKQVADKVSIKTEDGKKILSKQYEKLSFVGSNTALSDYLNPDNQSTKSYNSNSTIFYPFGCNLSQMEAVNNAFSNKISIIEGPPGTGKTQTILNIIANAVIRNKTVAVVSNNNSATDNVFEKLQKYGFDFIVAQLGNSNNKQNFIENKQTAYPGFNNYKYDSERLQDLKNNIVNLKTEIQKMLSANNHISELKAQLSAVKTEKQYFDEYFNDTYDKTIDIKEFLKLKSSQVLRLWIECQLLNEQNKEISFLNKLKYGFKYGFWTRSLFKIPLKDLIPIFQKTYYKLKISELENEIKYTEKKLQAYKFKDKLSELSDKSMTVFKNSLYQKYNGKTDRIKFTIDDLFKDPYNFICEYPVVLSTAYSLRTSLNKDFVYDYVIVDEASQVDLITGVLALSCAENIVVVGDLMQLPNVISPQTRKMVEPITESFNLKDGYKYENNSLLSSICSIFPDVSRTLLREHYRCHPKIIEFCNQKFYQNQLIVMTQDNNEEDVLKVYKTVEGNHARGRYNQRQIDEIKHTVIPELESNNEDTDIGIIAPYRAQTNALQNDMQEDIDISTVHKFQGREKDDIIISTVDNEISEFTDNPNMLNVAVSRAKKRLRVVISENEKNDNTNIGDLIKYIEYNNFEVVKGEVYSVFDLLYKDYYNQRNEYLKAHKKVSEFDSENLMYALIEKVLNNDNFKKCSVVVHQPLNMLIRDPNKLTDKECKYVMNSATHLDFLIYNKLNKLPILAIEVDGFDYHKTGTVQAERDILKNKILEKYNIPLLRFKTNGSQEEKLLTEKLYELLEIDK